MTEPIASIAPVLRRWRRSRKTMRVLCVMVALLIVLVVCLFDWATSASFQDSVRRRIVVALQDATGGRVEIASFHWDLLHLRAEASGLTIHGLEAPTELPYAHVDRLSLQLGILDLFRLGSPTHIVLHEAVIAAPEFHLIVYPDGTTNQPHPSHPSNSRPALDNLFDAQIGHLSIQQGTAIIANQKIPVNLEATDIALQLAWVPPHMSELIKGAKFPGNYRIQASLGNLSFAQGKIAPVTSRIDASLNLFHDSVQLNSLRMTAKNQTLELHGKLTSFAHPRWQASAAGQVDLQILPALAAFSNAPSGIVSLNATATGQAGQFLSTGDLSSNAIHYQDLVVDAQTAAFSAKFRAENKQLLVTAIKTRLAQGGAVDGEFQYDNWLETTPSPAAQASLRRNHQTFPFPAGIVRASLNGVSLDTILTLLAAPQYRHLGLDAVVNGPAFANWTGIGDNLAVGGQFKLSPSQQARVGEAPVNGSVDAAYHLENGTVQVNTLDVHLPHSNLQGQGALGVYPIDRTSQMDVSLSTTDLSEFDAVLKTLELKQGARMGTAALPFYLPTNLTGSARFQGQLTSSWLTPRIDGHLNATNIGLQVPSGSPDPAAPQHFVNWDSIDADGLYTPASIVLRNGVLRHGPASLTLEGYLNSPDPNYKLNNTADEFTASSQLGIKATAQQFPVADLMAFAGISQPIAGNVDARIDVRGQLKTLAGTGTLDVAKANLYGEPIDHIHATGTADGRQINITSLTASKNGGQLTGAGSYDLATRDFKVQAQGSSIDLASFHQLQQLSTHLNGKLAFSLNGDGAFDDPHLQAKATLSSMNIAGQPVSDVVIAASSLHHAVTYDLNSHQPAGQLTAHGETKLDADYTTQASAKFSQFDIGALLQLLKVTGITGQSDLEGAVHIAGPLRHLDRLNGDASLNELALAIQGVHLKSKGAVRATLANGVAHLDPLEVTGEDTDLRIKGTLAIVGKQQLDLEASGSVNMRLAESLDPDLVASGVTSFQVEAHGPVSSPLLQGKVEFKNAALALQDFPNGLSQITGTLEFIQNRLEVRSLTAQSGGGQLSVLGYIGFQKGLYADLSATGKSIRIRYPQGVSSLADATLRLQGPQNNLQLSGNVQVTRFAINSDLDVAALTAQSTSVAPVVAADSPSNRIRLDVHLTSAPQLNFQNAYGAKLAGDVDLHLRGTLATPSLLGRIQLTDGSTSIGGTRYELQRGDINFNNPVRIQPNIDLDATARVEDYDITLGLHGTPEKLKISYRSEPPLPEADVIALLALGRTQNEQTAYAQQQQQAGDNPMTDALLGGALNATVSNRVQKLFGSGAIKVDPNFIGSLGNSTARVTVVEQIGKNLTFTYASNVNTTTQQLIQAEVAINRHVSLLLTQDESGIFSVVVKARRRFN